MSAPPESFVCPLRMVVYSDEDMWLCLGRRCGWYDGRMHCCGIFSLVVMSKVFAKIDREDKLQQGKRDPYSQYMRES